MQNQQNSVEVTRVTPGTIARLRALERRAGARAESPALDGFIRAFDHGDARRHALDAAGTTIPLVPVVPDADRVPAPPESVVWGATDDTPAFDRVALASYLAAVVVSCAIWATAIWAAMAVWAVTR